MMTTLDYWPIVTSLLGSGGAGSEDTDIMPAFPQRMPQQTEEKHSRTGVFLSYSDIAFNDQSNAAFLSVNKALV